MLDDFRYDGSVFYTVIVTTRPDGTDQQVLVPREGSIDTGCSPRWSPRGNEILFVTDGGIFFAKADTYDQCADRYWFIR